MSRTYRIIYGPITTTKNIKKYFKQPLILIKLFTYIIIDSAIIVLNFIRKENHMASKAIATIGGYIAQKVSNKTVDKAMQKISKPYERLKREIFGIKPLNVGEKETIKCLQNPNNSTYYCKSVGDIARKNYHKTGKYK